MCIICFLRTHTVQLVLHAWFYQEHLIFVLTTVTTIFTATTTQVIVPEKYRSDFEDMQNRFAQLFDEVVEILENEESVTPERLKRYVSKIPEMSDSLDNAHTISDIIDIILKHSSLTCCTYLKGVARRFNISAVTEKIEKYYQFVSEFCQYFSGTVDTPHLHENSVLERATFSPFTEVQWLVERQVTSDI